MGEKELCIKASKSLHDIGYYKVSIKSKVLEISKYLIKDEISDEIIENIRNRGYKVNRLYWINLVFVK